MSKLVAKGTRVPEGWVVVARCPVYGEYVALGTVATLSELKATLLMLGQGEDTAQAPVTQPARVQAKRLWGMDLRKSIDEDRRAA